jgi:hypothetical protein
VISSWTARLALDYGYVLLAACQTAPGKTRAAVINDEMNVKLSNAASGNCFHHLLLSRGNFHHRRKVQYIGALIYGYCLYCLISETFEEDA